MYVAMRELLETMPDGGVVRRFPGDEVATFTSWPVVNQLAALNTRTIREAPATAQPLTVTVAEVSPPSETMAAKRRAFDQAAASQAERDATAPKRFVCKLCTYAAATARGLAIHVGRDHKEA